MHAYVVIRTNLTRHSRQEKEERGCFATKDLNDQFDACHELFRHFQVAFDHSMTHKAKAPDGLDAFKLDKSDGAICKPSGAFTLCVIEWAKANHIS